MKEMINEFLKTTTNKKGKNKHRYIPIDIEQI